MLYVYVDSDNDAEIVRVSHLNPHEEPDYEKMLAESFKVDLDNAKQIPASIKANIIRNVLAQGLPPGSVTLL